jgi:putative methyltransferase (TIGR04325 family)
MYTQSSSPQPIFKGFFSNWFSACEAASVSSEALINSAAFDTTRWMNRQREMLASARLGQHPRPTNLPLLAAVCGAEFIVDLGGGSGWTSELLAKSETSQSGSYIVLEIPSICKEFSEEFSNDSEVSFFSSLLDAPKWRTSHTDILYSNSVLQYFEDNSTLTKLVSLLQPEWVLIDDFLSSSNETFYTLQNYHGIDIPCRFSEILEIEKSFTTLGYQLMFKTNYSSQIANGWEFRIESNDKFGSDIAPSVSLLFKRLFQKN